jgi:hypothetical protein
VLNILIGIPSTREDKRFLESLDSFLKELKERYKYTVLWQKNVRLKDAQNFFVKEFLGGEYDYLLMLDDDHWGHKIEMLDVLIGANAPMATIKSYSRHYPYFCCLMNQIPNDNFFSGIDVGEGYIQCDMTGFPMTLFRKDLFDKLSYPYFEEESEGGRTWVTDTIFCRKLRNIGIRPTGCFQYCLPHGEITEDNVLQKRISDGVKWEGIVLQLMNNRLTKGNILCNDLQLAR